MNRVDVLGYRTIISNIMIFVTLLWTPMHILIKISVDTWCQLIFLKFIKRGRYKVFQVLNVNNFYLSLHLGL